jgi:hypothetical protein
MIHFAYLRVTLKMSLNRKEVAGLLMVGAGIIIGIETAFFSSWIQAIVYKTPNLARTVSIVGMIATIAMALIWIICRDALNAALVDKERLSVFVSLVFVASFCCIAFGWGYATWTADLGSLMAN